jgi:hypothetical protein
MPVVEETVRDVELEEKLAELRRLFETSRIPEARLFVKELALAWPEDPRVRHWDKVLAPPVARLIPGPGTGRDRTRDYQWLDEHASEYPGCWIAVYEGELVAADPSLATVNEMIRTTLPAEKIPLLQYQHRPE